MPRIRGKQLEDNAITTAKIAPNAVTAGKVDATVLIASGGNSLTGNFNAATNKITNLGDPTAPQDAATKNYVDAVAQDRNAKQSVRLATATPLPANTRTGNVLTASVDGTIPPQDGVILALNDRILVKDEILDANNGLYFVSALGSGVAPWTLTRTVDADTSSKVTSGIFSFVEEGTLNDNTGWILATNDPIILNTTGLQFVKFTGTGTITTAAPSVPLSVGSTAAVGSASSLLRSDATFTTPRGTPLSVGTANAAGSSGDFAGADHIHAIPRPVKVTKNLVAAVTLSDGDLATATPVSISNALGGYVGVRVNGVHYNVGDGTKIGVDCFFSGDGGLTARAMSAIVVSDTLRWNGSVVGFQLASSDHIDFIYEAF